MMFDQITVRSKMILTNYTQDVPFAIRDRSKSTLTTKTKDDGERKDQHTHQEVGNGQVQQEHVSVTSEELLLEDDAYH